MKKKLLTLVALLTTVVSGAWADTETLSGADATSKDGDITKTSVTMYGTYNPSGTSTINSKSVLKVRWKRSHSSTGGVNGFALKVNTGYKITGIEAQMSGNQGTITLEDIKIDGTSYSGSYSKTINASNAATGDQFTNINLSGIEAESYINFEIASTSAKDQGFVYITITYEEPAGVVAPPSITQDDNNVTLASATSGATIYYTTDGSEPTTSSTVYDGTPFTIDNSCTVRAFAKKGDVASDLVKRDCYVSHASAEGFLKVLNYNGGTIEGTVWTSTADGYTLTAPTENDLAYANLAGSQDGFKLTANKAYTIAISPDVQITKIVVVGKTWLAGTASTIAFDGFTPASGSFFEADGDRNTFVKTIEFTPSSELDYGQTITMTPGGNQLGAYIELYGVKRSGPANPTEAVEATETWTKNSSSEDVVDITPDGTNSIMTVSANTKDAAFGNYLKGWKIDSNLNITIAVPANVSTASITLYADAAATSLNLNGTSESTTWSDWDAGNDATGKQITIDVSSKKGTNYVIKKGNGAPNIYKMVLTYKNGNEGEIYLTTTANMAGWRAFYDASQGYTVDNKTTVYVVSANTETNVTLTDIGSSNIPAGTPVILKTTDTDRKMTLTKATLAAYTGDNELKASTAGQNLGTVYRLGYGDNGVGFYKYTTTSAAAGIVYVENVNGIDAPSLGIEIGGATAIEAATKSQHTETVVYNLNGQRVDQPTKGLYIVNGRKVVVK
jgi:hypothetical protein